VGTTAVAQRVGGAAATQKPDARRAKSGERVHVYFDEASSVRPYVW